LKRWGTTWRKFGACSTVPSRSTCLREIIATLLCWK
jgi:hypothetical protein